jgi:formamidopyrimidine-DNA glycosylase
MPELPEVQTVVFELHRKLKNRTIKQVVVNKPKMVAIGPKTLPNIRKASPAVTRKFITLLTGQKITKVSRRAKLLRFDLSGPLSLLVHLKMTGQFIFEDNKQRQKTGGKYRIINKEGAPLVQLPSPYTHVIFYFTDGSVLYFNDVRQFGYMKIVRDDEMDQVKELQEYGPEPLDKKFTYEVFAANVAK